MTEKLVYRRNSSVLLSFRPYTEENIEIPLDSAPIVGIYYMDSIGSLGLGSVILEPSVTMDYEGFFKIPDHWLYGEYRLEYTYSSNGETFVDKVFFTLENKEDIEEDKALFSNEILDEIMADVYIPSYHQQVPATVTVSGHEVRITLEGQAAYNTDYKVIVDGVRSKSGQVLGKQVVSTYTAAYSPLFTSPSDVASVLKGLYRFYETKEVYGAIRDAGQKALIMLRQNADPNNSRYREYAERNDNYFSLTRYVLYEASYNLLLDLYNKFLAANGVPGYLEDLAPEDPLAKILGSGFSLGDFTVSGIGDSIKGNDSELMDVVDSFTKKLKNVIDGIRRELKFWQDSMMSRNARGYTSPTTSTYKGGVTSPESRDI